MRLLELLDGRGHLCLDGRRLPVGLPSVLERVRRLALERDEALGIGLRQLWTARLEQLLLEHAELPLVFRVHAVRDVLQRAHRLLSRLALEKAQVGELEQGDRGCEALGGPRAEELARLVQRDDPGELPLESNAAQR